MALSLISPTPVKAQVAPVEEVLPPPAPVLSIDDKIALYAKLTGVDPKIMQNISHCERNLEDPTRINHNKDGSMDYSLFQINSIHQKDALKMGLDITKEDDNILFAIALYKSNGLSPWYASAECRKHLVRDV